ncbi:GNAT family N-acetyltransferase [Geodermatophilus sp. YIM 151500]|uniref:GNAT family N-acetyltransferase n=1 Tax=Geodermatophilus sp. YIM 151500 TaxID=2984531 RepID=UPI0021E41B2F|nr:GNAT family N-acetyltransferase [Geodermatophilus sp. YIM 151500]MCV2490932.1 GNAT family N-acetyltransferase [Geodermatophilus sp. YIM 151500]
MADLASALRPVTEEEWPAFARALFAAFAEEPPGTFAETPPAVAELDRSLGLFENGRVAATSGIYSRVLTVPGALVPCAGVTWVTVAPTHRRRGVLTAVMRRQLDGLHEQQREPVAALWASEASIYGRFGYAPAAERSGLTGGTERLRLRPGAPAGTGRVDVVDLDAYRGAAVGLHDRVRRAVPGNLDRDGRWWDRQLEDDPARRHGASARRYLLHTEADGAVTGYAAYRVKGGWSDAGEPDATLTVEEVRASTPAGYAALWRFLLSVDLVRTVRYRSGPVDDPLRHLVADPRALHVAPVDTLWVRLVDVDRALAARRYPTPIDLVLEVRDDFCHWNAGRWRLSGHPAGGYCGRTDRDPDLVLGVEDLAAAYLGGVSLATLQGAGRVTEVSPGAVTLASTAFGWPVPPWCPDDF